MILKWAGALMILAAGPGLGWWMADRWKKRLEQLEELRRLIYSLKGEITYSQAPLGEAFERSGRRCQGPLGQMFLQVSREIGQRQGDSLDQIWKRQAEQLVREHPDLPLNREDIDHLKGLGSQLGYLDIQMQERTLLLYLEQLDLAIGYLREHKKEKCRLYTSLGMMGGLFLVIVLC